MEQNFERIDLNMYKDEVIKKLQEFGVHSVQDVDTLLEPNYFAIIPSHVLSSKTLTPNAKLLYAQMIALSRKSGRCFAHNKRLGDSIGISDRSIPHLLEELRNENLIKIDIRRDKKGTWRNIYVNPSDIAFLEGGPHPTRGASQDDEGSNAELRGQIRRKREERREDLKYSEPSSQVKEVSPPYKEKSLEIKENVDTGAKDIAQIIDSFKEVNPSYKKFFGNTTQRGAVTRLLSHLGAEKLLRVVARLKETNSMPYAPIITTPLQLEDKLAQLAAFVQKEQNKKQNSKVAFI